MLAYTFVGYPLLMELLARFSQNSVRADSSYQPTVSALIPVYNGADCLRDKVVSLRASKYPQEQLEILLYLDGCTDASRQIAATLAAEYPPLKIVDSETRTGKPAGLNAMAAQATGEVFLLTDMRQPVCPEAVSRLVAALADRSVTVASGTLRLSGSTGTSAYWRYETWIRRNESRFGSMLGATGALYALHRDQFHNLPTDIILDDMWLPMRARLRKGRTVFVDDASCLDRAFADGREFTRKTRTLAGSYQLFVRMPKLLSPVANPSWLETVSHKLLRLVAPWLLLTLLLSSFTLAVAGKPFFIVLTAAQLLFYALAGCGGAAGVAGRLARSFVIMNAAAMLGLYRYLTKAQKVTW